MNLKIIALAATISTASLTAGPVNANMKAVYGILAGSSVVSFLAWAPTKLLCSVSQICSANTSTYAAGFGFLAPIVYIAGDVLLDKITKRIRV